MTATEKFTKGLATFASDIAQGFFEITHNGFALLGLAVMFAVITLTATAGNPASRRNPADGLACKPDRLRPFPA
jgi:hypothetical protein